MHYFSIIPLCNREGGNSKSYAELTLVTPLTAAIDKGEPILGRNAEGVEVAGKAYQEYESGSAVIKVQYSTTDRQASYVECQVGGMLEGNHNTKGCFVGEGHLTVGGQQYSYVYEVDKDNKNGRTIAGFSTGAREKMLTCENCPYTDFYYSAFIGGSTTFKNGNADFSHYSLEGKEQVIKKGTVYMNIFMYVIREFEDALDDCENACIDCNDGFVHAWDEGVCFYTGSVEGQDGKMGDGKLLHQLADYRCGDYKNCGPDGTDLEGMAKVNYDIFDHFAVGTFYLMSGNCAGARDVTKKITTKMYVPMIQGAMRYAYRVDKMQGGEREKAEGAVFAAAILPRVHAASPNAASTIYENLRVGASSTSYQAVKNAFESVYPQLGIACSDVGGLWNRAMNIYYEGMEPCMETVPTYPPTSARPTTDDLTTARPTTDALPTARPTSFDLVTDAPVYTLCQQSYARWRTTGKDCLETENQKFVTPPTQSPTKTSVPSVLTGAPAAAATQQKLCHAVLNAALACAFILFV
ncbi:hypothetical protein ACHAXR_006286 [Thalassiosira sp. AJA248-18]